MGPLSWPTNTLARPRTAPTTRTGIRPHKFTLGPVQLDMHLSVLSASSSEPTATKGVFGYRPARALMSAAQLGSVQSLTSTLVPTLTAMNPEPIPAEAN